VTRQEEMKLVPVRLFFLLAVGLVITSADAILTRVWAKLPMAMDCPAIEPAQAARELVVRDRSPKEEESPPSARVRSKFDSVRLRRVPRMGGGPCGGARDLGQDAKQEAGLEARGANRQTPTARQCARLPVA
jgi:hypothetical protein